MKHNTPHSLAADRRPRRRLAAVVVALTLGATLTACGDDTSGVAVEAAWARTSPMATSAGAAYFTITSDEADVLIGASVDPSIAGRVEIHESQMVAMDDMDEHDMDEHDHDMDDMDEHDHDMDDMESMGDVMQMVEVGRIELAAGDTVSLEPGGLHLMLLDLPEPLAEGSTFDVTLDFENGEDQVVTVEVRDSAPE